MKKSEIAMIALIAITSVLISYFVVNSFLGTKYTVSTTVKTIDPISIDDIKPDAQVFNKNAIDPSVQISITKPVTTQ